jgi:hypothetical protein
LRKGEPAHRALGNQKVTKSNQNEKGSQKWISQMIKNHPAGGSFLWDDFFVLGEKVFRTQEAIFDKK